MMRVAVLGTGSMGRIHAHACAAIPGVTVVAVAGRDPTRTAAFAEPLRARSYTDIDQLLDREELDVVCCCFPTDLHRHAVERIAAHGRHVICEKPLALTLEDGRAMIESCQAAGVQLLIGQVVRFFPAYRRLTEALQGGRIGTPVTGSLLRQGFYPTGRDGWYRDEERSGGVFIDLMIHDLDWALQRFGPAARVFARLVARRGERPFAQGMATIRHRSGVLSQITATWGHPGPFNTAVELVGTAGLLSFDTGTTGPLQLLAPSERSVSGGVALPDLSTGEDPYSTELQHFMEVVAGRAEPLVHPEESLAALELALAARGSAASGQAQTIAGKELSA